MFLRNVGGQLQVLTASQPRRPPSTNLSMDSKYIEFPWIILEMEPCGRTRPSHYSLILYICKERIQVLNEPMYP
jgi:hypothetical protein